MDDWQAGPAGVSWMRWEQWNPIGLARIAERAAGRSARAELDGTSVFVRLAELSQERSRLLEPLAREHGRAGLLLVFRLAEGELSAVNADLVVVAAGIMAPAGRS